MMSCSQLPKTHVAILLWFITFVNILAQDKVHVQLKSTLKFDTEINRVSFSPDGKLLALACDDKTVLILDVSTGKTKATLAGHKACVLCVAFSPDGKNLLSSTYQTGEIILWNIETGKLLRSLEGHEKTNAVWSVAFSPDGKTIASGSWDRMIKLWNPQTGKETVRVEKQRSHVESVVFSPDSKTVVSAGSDRTLKLWDVPSGRQLTTLRKMDHFPVCVAFSPDGKLLACGSSSWDVFLFEITGANNTTVAKDKALLKGHGERIYSVNFSPDGKILASGSWDTTAKLWNVETGNVMATLTGHEKRLTAVVFAPDGKLIATSSVDNTVKIWELKGNK